MLGNKPKQPTPVACERAKSFSLGLWFLDLNESPIDLTGAQISFVARQTARYGGTQIISELFGLVSATEGFARLDLQAADLDLTARDYEYAVTLKTAENYTLVVLEGSLTISENPESAWVATEYGGVLSSQNLTVTLGRQNRVNVTVGMPVNLQLTIGTVTTLPVGSPATATITGTFPNLRLNLGLPTGATGAPGA